MRLGCRYNYGGDQADAAQQGLAADTKQRSPIEPWYRSGGGHRCPSADGQRCLVQLKPDPFGGWIPHSRCTMFTVEVKMSAVVLFPILALWVCAFMIVRFRNRPEELSQRLPLLRKYRDPVFRPLFRSSTDVLWFAFWPFALGVIFLVVVLVRGWRAA